MYSWSTYCILEWEVQSSFAILLAEVWMDSERWLKVWQGNRILMTLLPPILSLSQPWHPFPVLVSALFLPLPMPFCSPPAMTYWWWWALPGAAGMQQQSSWMEEHVAFCNCSKIKLQSLKMNFGSTGLPYVWSLTLLSYIHVMRENPCLDQGDIHMTCILDDNFFPVSLGALALPSMDSLAY